jgi:putative ABC transport system permease protein
VFLFFRPGATHEGDSFFRRDKALQLVKTVPEIREDETGQPIASIECYVAIRRFRVNGGETNVPVRGLEPRSLEIHRNVRIVEGRTFHAGADEVVVGRKLVDRIRDCHLGDVIQINLTPLRVVGIFESDGPFESEIWGDLDRMLSALDRPFPNRVVARLDDGVDVAALGERMKKDKDIPAKVLSEKEYLASMTAALSGTLMVLGAFLAFVMGIAAVFTATNTMLAAVSARTHEIGILLAGGFRPFPVFLSFLFEAVVLGLLGGVAGCAVTLPLNGLQTGATNFNTFTEVAFAFRVTPGVLLTAVLFALALGLLGGAVPAWRAARMVPVDALRRR